jgi:hypothetical protein
LVLIYHLMSDLGWHRGKHHCSLMSLTPITFDANTFSCCGGSYFATIAVFCYKLPKTSELGRATNAHITVVVLLPRPLPMVQSMFLYRIVLFLYHSALEGAAVVYINTSDIFSSELHHTSMGHACLVCTHLYIDTHLMEGRVLPVPFFSKRLLYTVPLLLSLTTPFSVKETLMDFGYTFFS